MGVARELALALLGPGVVSAAFLAALWAPSPSAGAWDAARRRQLDADPDRDLALLRPSVVVLGNSVAHLGVDPLIVGDLLDLPGEVALLHEPGSLPPTWYLLLDNEVLAQPRPPELVVVVANPPNLLEVLPQSDVDFARMLIHLDGDDPVVEAALDAAGSGWRTRRARVALRTVLLDGARDLGVGLLGPSGPGGWWDRAHSAAERAAAVVFPADGGGRDVPVAFDGSASAADPSMTAALVRRARDAGAQVAVVQPPVRVNTVENTSPPETHAALVAAVEAAGGVWIDLSAPPPADAFMNDHHLDERGQAWFSARLAGALRKAGLRPDRPAPTVLPAPEARRVGEPGPLPAVFDRSSVRRSCGRAWEASGLSHLQEDGPRMASPVVVLEDGVALARRGTPGAPLCRGTYRLIDGALAVAPLGEGPLTLAWDPSPVLRPPPYRGQQWADQWWVAPGTTTEIGLPDGPYTLRVAGELYGGRGSVRVEVNGERLSGLVDPRRMSVVAAGEVPAGPARLRVGTLAEGAAVTIDEVALRRPGEDRWTFVIRSGRRPLGGGEAAPETR